MLLVLGNLLPSTPPPPLPLLMRKLSERIVTVTGGNEAGADLVLVQPFLLCYVNHVLMLTSIFLSIISIRKRERFVSKQGQSPPHIHSKAGITVKWSIVKGKVSLEETSRFRKLGLTSSSFR